MPATGPLVGCNTCRCFIEPENIKKGYDEAQKRWIYTIAHHGQTFEVARIKQPFADSEPIHVGIWSPTFKCNKCGRSGIRATLIKRKYPFDWQSTFKVEHCGETFYEMFITDALNDSQRDIELTNYQNIAPFPEPQAAKPQKLALDKRRHLANGQEIEQFDDDDGKHYRWCYSTERYEIESAPTLAPGTAAALAVAKATAAPTPPAPAKAPPATVALPKAAIPIQRPSVRRIRFAKEEAAPIAAP
jgi:hypothetical protein